MLDYIPRILIGGTGSGCGKTTVSCAILQALVERGMAPAAFKCGPDYIDPMFHSQIIGAKSSNIDLFLFSEDTARYLLAKNARGCDLAVIEGAMGYYDGIVSAGSRASSWHIAEATASPAILVLNGRGASVSLLAALKGFLELEEKSMIQGVIFNGCDPVSYKMLADEVERRFDARVKPLGYFPLMPQCSLESRHLGLITAQEVLGLKEKLHLLAAQAERSIDLEAVLELAKSADELGYAPVVIPKQKEQVRIAFARDKAFCFYYEDSLDVLREMGAELLPFSPMKDDKLPPDIQGLYLGGGYPELYAEDLSRNQSLRLSIKTALSAGLPCIAECGGFMYLTQEIDGRPMVGLLPGSCFDTGKLCRFGYVNLTAKKDNILCRAGESIAAHEFHHWDSEDPGASFTAEKLSGRSWPCVHADEKLYAGFPHIHFYSAPASAENFYNACLKEKHRYDTRDQTDGYRKTQL